MIKLDENLLVELGLATLPKDEKASFLKHMYETLEMRVGTRLAERMNDQQMSEFEQFINSNDEQGAFHWLESNFPNYKDVVAEEFEKLKNEIKPMAPDILAASQAQAQQAQAGTLDQSAQYAQPAQSQGHPAQDPQQPPYQSPAPMHPAQFQSQPQQFQEQPTPPAQHNPQHQPYGQHQQPVHDVQNEDPSQQPGHHPQYPSQQ